MLLARTVRRCPSLTCRAFSQQASSAAPDSAQALSPDWAVSRISAVGERCTTIAVQGGHTITVDAPRQLGGRDQAPGPVAHFLGSLVGAQQTALHQVAEEAKVRLGKVSWTAEAKMDARPLHGEGVAVAVFDSVVVTAEVETDADMALLQELQATASQRSIVANTLRQAGIPLDVTLKRRRFFASSMGTYIP